MTVGVAIPSIPPRGKLLARAVASVAAQTYPVDHISIAIDNGHEGAAVTRNWAKNALDTEFTCFLDDDDELYPFHVQRLIEHQEATGADLVFSWYDVVGGEDPLAELEHIEWNDATPHSFGITVLLRTELAQSIDFEAPEFALPACAGEDWLYFTRLLAAGAHFAHLHERTWRWFHNSANTAGLASRW